MRTKIACTFILAVTACTGCGLMDWVKSLGSPDIECPPGEVGPSTLELKMVGDEMSCPLFETVREDLVSGGPVWIEEESFSIHGQGGHPCHLASHEPHELYTIVNVLPLPEGVSISYGEDHSQDGKSTWKAYLLEEPAVITGKHVAKAHVQFNDQIMNPVVVAELTDVGARAFEIMTGKNVARRLAILVDGEVVSAPIIREKIAGGKIQIAMGAYGPHDELYCRAEALADALNGE